MKTNILQTVPTSLRRPLSLLTLTLGLAGSAFAAPPPTMIGANIACGEFPEQTGRPYPGVLGTDYWYPNADSIDQAKAAGVELVRVPFTWERVQRDTNGVFGALYEPDMTALDASIAAMEARGMRIILDMHNYGARIITVGGVRTKHTIGPEGSPVPASAFANAWKLIADRYKNRPSIWGYDLMNEPMGVLSTNPAINDPLTTAEWVEYLQLAVNAIREVDTKNAIILEPARLWAHTKDWQTIGAPLLAVTDSANNLVYSGHCYTDRWEAGQWNNGKTVSAELVGYGYANQAAALYVGRDRVKPFVDWCVANNVRGLVGEYGSPPEDDQANWDTVTSHMLSYIKNNGNGLVSATQWAYGGIAAGEPTRMQALRDNSAPSLAVDVFPDYVSGIGTNYWPKFLLYRDDLSKGRYGSLAYVYGGITVNTANTSPFWGSSGKSLKLSFALPANSIAGAGIHLNGPLVAGGQGGIDLSRAKAADHVLSFYARTNLAGTAASVALAETMNSGVDNGSTITATSKWVSLSAISALPTASWTRYQIPLASLFDADVDGTQRVQRLLFNVGPFDGVAREIYFDEITIDLPSPNNAPTVTVNTSTGGSSFTAGASVTLVSTATDADAGDSIDYVEFYANGVKVGIDDITPYQVATSFATAGTYAVTAIAYDSRGISKQSTVKTLTITAATLAAPTGLAAITGDTRAILDWNTVSGATSYNVKRATVSGGPYTTVASPTSPTWTDTGRANGTAYYYVVSAVSGSTQSANSAQVSVTPQAITIIVDNLAAVRTGTWYSITTTPGYYGTDYLHEGSTGTAGGKSVRFTPTITTPGYYEVYARWVAGPNRATNAPIDVNSATGTATTRVNQEEDSNEWKSLGTHYFAAGTTGNLTVRNDGANEHVIADAAQFILR